MYPLHSNISKHDFSKVSLKFYVQHMSSTSFNSALSDD